MRYFLFAAPDRETRGGWSDMIGAFPSIDRAKISAEGFEFDGWAQIVDVYTGRVIHQGKRNNASTPACEMVRWVWQ